MHSNDQPRVLKRYELNLAAGWTVVILVLLCINVLHERTQTLEMARIQARSNFQRDVTYRQWNAASGSVYVEISKETPPNPYLSNIPERDVVTTTGKRLTLVNPAYMSRLVFDLAEHSQEVRGHICSLRPLRAQNIPDRWEAEALQAFARGEKEVSSVEKISGSTYLRLMSPLYTSVECLKCHGKQGYHTGEVRGGITVAVPMAPFWRIFRQNVALFLMSFFLLWLTGMSGIMLGASRLRKTIRERDEAEEGVVNLNNDLMATTAELRTANAELDSFCATVSHDLRSPLSGIGGYCQLIQQHPSDGYREACIEYAGTMLSEVNRMEKLIETLLKFARLTRTEVVRRPTDLSGMAEEVLTGLHLAAPARKARLVVMPGIKADCDPALIRVVLQNLLGNAWKYTGKEGAAQIEFGAVTDGAETIYFVRDNGIGFDQADGERMFQAFQRLSNVGAFEGTGIGLATVKRIVDRHGGRIWCAGEREKGATFYFTLQHLLDQ